MNRIIITAVLIFLGFAGLAYAIQDEMAVGRFIPTKTGWQVVVFHFDKGKTHVRFFEKLSDSQYLFPIYVVMLQGQILEQPEIKDTTNDDLLEIYYKTTAEQGIIYFDRDSKALVNVHPKKGEKPRVSFKDELKLLDND
ncbi:MAG: hypothetical protein RBU23_03400 [Candidatus Auribacterota bacterium]|nr:hypothetical protein [Candidatus Auribacterota bacterium]